MGQFLLLLLISALFLLGFAGPAIFRKGVPVRWPILGVIVLASVGICKVLMSLTQQTVAGLVLQDLVPVMALLWIARIPAVSLLLIQVANTIMASREASERQRLAKSTR